MPIDYLRHIEEALEKATGRTVKIGTLKFQGVPDFAELPEDEQRTIAASVIEDITKVMHAEDQEDADLPDPPLKEEQRIFAEDMNRMAALLHKARDNPDTNWTDEEKEEYSRLAIEDAAFFLQTIKVSSKLLKDYTERNEILISVLTSLVQVVHRVDAHLDAGEMDKAKAQLKGMDWAMVARMLLLAQATKDSS